MKQYLDHMRQSERLANEDKEAALNEAYGEYVSFVQKRARDSARPMQQIHYAFDTAKKVLCEAFTDLYVESIPIDEWQQYSGQLREMAGDMFTDEIKDCKNMKQLVSKFEHSAPYMKNFALIAEAIGELKADEIAKSDEEFPPEVILDHDDMKCINDFEKAEGKSDVADAIKDRVVDVYQAEAKLAADQQEKTQKIVNALSEKNNDTVTESVFLNGIQLAGGNQPQTLFNAIFMNKSKAILNEAGLGANLDLYKEDVLVETLCTYTLLECVHGLGIKTFDSNERQKLKMQFASR